MTRWLCSVLAAVVLPAFAFSAERPTLTDYFPPPGSTGGWRSDLTGDHGIDHAKLKEAWDYNAKSEGATGLLVIRNGYIVGEWYKDCDRNKAFNIYSSSKAYTSLAYGLLLADSDAGKLP